MKCRDCTCCHKGYFASAPESHVCTGVAEPFIIGDINNECTEYPEKRNEVVIMNTAEMWLKAQEDGKVYECLEGDMAYSREMGLVDKDNFNEPWGLDAWAAERENGLDSLMECEWKEMDTAMTIEEAERKFGIKIVKH